MMILVLEKTFRFKCSAGLVLSMRTDAGFVENTLVSKLRSERRERERERGERERK